jgi:hypothetical protein
VEQPLLGAPFGYPKIIWIFCFGDFFGDFFWFFFWFFLLVNIFWFFFRENCSVVTVAAAFFMNEISRAIVLGDNNGSSWEGSIVNQQLLSSQQQQQLLAN